MRSRKVLVVDDDADWRHFLSESLSELGWEPAEAQDGEAALSQLEAGDDIGVVLLDMSMPGMSGEQVAAQVPQDGPKVVFLTALPPHEMSSALMQGAHYYLPKGATREQLSLLLDSLHVT
jgi:CheY-like chemotaxis protein